MARLRFNRFTPPNFDEIGIKKTNKKCFYCNNKNWKYFESIFPLPQKIQRLVCPRCFDDYIERLKK